MNKETKELVQSVVETYEDVQDSQNITPGAEISVIYMKDSHLESVHMYWGYSLALSSKLVINARCETVLDKKMFKNDIQKRRCLIPSTGFYEWDHLKHQISFSNDKNIVWLAGIYNQHGEVVILTTNANEVMKPVHSRMPLMIHENDIQKWFDDKSYKELLLNSDNDLKIVAGNIQQSLF